MNRKVLLYSGGTDSWLMDKLWKPDLKLYVDIEGRYSREEIERLPADVEIVKMPHLAKFEQPNAYVPFRNLYFLTVAANYGDSICYGATMGDGGGKDNTPQFVDMLENLLNYCLENDHRVVSVERRFFKMNKYLMLKEYLENGGCLQRFVEETFSCHSPVDGRECLCCKACYRKFLLCKYFGHRFPEEVELKMLDYLKSKVIPLDQTRDGTYFTKRAGEGEYAEIAMDKFFKERGLEWRDFQ